MGGYRDYFNDAQVTQIDALVNDRLDPVFGYREGVAVTARSAL